MDEHTPIHLLRVCKCTREKILEYLVTIKFILHSICSSWQLKPNYSIFSPSWYSAQSCITKRNRRGRMRDNPFLFWEWREGWASRFSLWLWNTIEENLQNDAQGAIVKTSRYTDDIGGRGSFPTAVQNTQGRKVCQHAHSHTSDFSFSFLEGAGLHGNNLPVVGVQFWLIFWWLADRSTHCTFALVLVILTCGMESHDSIDKCAEGCVGVCETLLLKYTSIFCIDKHTHMHVFWYLNTPLTYKKAAATKTTTSQPNNKQQQF